MGIISWLINAILLLLASAIKVASVSYYTSTFFNKEAVKFPIQKLEHS